MDMFWGESPTDKARQNLLTTLTRVRNVFRKNFEDAGPSEYIIKEGNSIRFDTRSPYTLDVEDFEASIDAGKKSFERGDAEKGAVELQRAVKLYGGDLLEGIYEDWCAPFREELREGYISALADLARHFGSKGKMEAAINCAKMILDRDPFNTRGMISLMTGLAAVGKRDLAVRKYHEYAKRMEAEMSLGPDPEVMRAYYGIVDGGQKE
jgi:DNA-binding SARP family transcriptional activator